MLQIIREMRCDQYANATYASAHQLLVAGGASHDIGGSRDPAKAWNYTPLEETCVLFARKFLPDTNEEVASFFTDCSQIGLGSNCLTAAAANQTYERR